MPPAPATTTAGPGLLRCALHGVFRQSFEFGRPMGCSDCAKDRKHGRSAEQAAAVAEILHRGRLEGCGLVGRYQRTRLENFAADTPAKRAVLKACRTYAETADAESSRGLMLIGPVGVGKTHLLAAMAWHLRFERAVSAMVATPRAIVQALRSCWAKDAEQTEEDVVASLAAGLDVLLLDEAGVGFGSDAELVQLFEVIDARYALGRPTVVASNLTSADMKRALGDRIFDRLREGVEVHTMNWPSHRGRA